MRVTELLQLVNRYTLGDIDYATFRREFVSLFLSVRSEDQSVACAVAEIESLCADVAERIILSEIDLRNKLMAIVEPAKTGNEPPNKIQFFRVAASLGQRSLSSGSTSVGSTIPATA